jgi:hypothetical protein
MFSFSSDCQGWSSTSIPTPLTVDLIRTNDESCVVALSVLGFSKAFDPPDYSLFCTKLRYWI